MNGYHRRDFLKMGAAFLATSVLPLKAFAAAVTPQEDRRNLAFYNIHTNERLEINYFSRGRYVPEALNQINHILRDHRNNEVHMIHTDLLDLLYTVKQQTDLAEPFSVISGYRSPATNEMLRRNTSGVAKRSYHTKGQAIDIRLPGFDTSRLRKICRQMKAGGVGYYPRSDFVHLDVGPVRTW